MSESKAGDFEILTRLGEGSYGKVYKVRRKIDNNIYVQKQIDVSSYSQHNLVDKIREVAILASLDSPYIVKYFDSFIESNMLFLIMQYCDKGDLGHHIKQQMNVPFLEKKIWKFFIQMLLGIEYLHNKNVLHRDISTKNIFLTRDYQIRIGDFGMSTILPNLQRFAGQPVGTPVYYSPEQCRRQPYNAKADVWSLGCVLYELCTYRYPYEGSTSQILIQKILNSKPAKISKFYSDDLHYVIELCLIKDPNQRPSVSDMLSLKIIKEKAKALQIIIKSEEREQKMEFEGNLMKKKVSFARCLRSERPISLLSGMRTPSPPQAIKSILKFPSDQKIERTASVNLADKAFYRHTNTSSNKTVCIGSFSSTKPLLSSQEINTKYTLLKKDHHLIFLEQENTREKITTVNTNISTNSQITRKNSPEKARVKTLLRSFQSKKSSSTDLKRKSSSVTRSPHESFLSKNMVSEKIPSEIILKSSEMSTTPFPEHSPGGPSCTPHELPLKRTTYPTSKCCSRKAERDSEEHYKSEHDSVIQRTHYTTPAISGKCTGTGKGTGDFISAENKRKATQLAHSIHKINALNKANQTPTLRLSTYYPPSASPSQLNTFLDSTYHPTLLSNLNSNTIHLNHPNPSPSTSVNLSALPSDLSYSNTPNNPSKTIKPNNPINVINAINSTNANTTTHSLAFYPQPTFQTPGSSSNGDKSPNPPRIQNKSTVCSQKLNKVPNVGFLYNSMKNSEKERKNLFSREIVARHIHIQSDQPESKSKSAEKCEKAMERKASGRNHQPIHHFNRPHSSLLFSQHRINHGDRQKKRYSHYIRCQNSNSEYSKMKQSVYETPPQVVTFTKYQYE